MIATIQWLKLIVKTSSTSEADTESRFEFHYYHNSRWWQVNLDNPHDDRESGRTDTYDINISDVEGHHPGIGHIPDHVPPYGINYDGWSGLLAENTFHIHARGNDGWRIDSCQLLANVVATYVPIGSSTAINSHLGWYLIDRIPEVNLAAPFWLSTDQSDAGGTAEERLWFDLTRGAFPTPSFPEAIEISDYPIAIRIQKTVDGRVKNPNFDEIK